MATSKAFVTNESELTISGIAGADHAWSIEGTETGTGQSSIQIDLGARPGAYLMSWNSSVEWQGTPTVGTSMDYYYCGAADGTATIIDGGIAATDTDIGATALVQAPNYNYFGSVIVDTADTSAMVASGAFAYYGRYISFVGINNGGTTLNATDSNFEFYLTVRAIQGQAT